MALQVAEEEEMKDTTKVPASMPRREIIVSWEESFYFLISIPKLSTL